MIHTILPGMIGQLQGFSLPTPTSDFNPAFDCYTDAGTTPCTNGTLVYQWDDNGVLANTAQQTNATSRPTWYSDGGAARNNKPYVDFPGLDYMEIIDSSTDYRDSEMTFYMVVDVNSPGSYDTLLSKNSDYNWDDGWIFYTNSSGDHNTCINEWSAGVISNTDGTINAEVRAFRFKQSATGAQNNNRVNTNTDDTGTTFTTVDTPIKNTLISASWNSSGTGASLYADYYCYRILIYNEYHDDTKYGEIIDYLMNEYGI
tara:strand:+ start:19 stop:792 length:774 start_codon:yes stop_codon:yes gene_type:complete